MFLGTALDGDSNQPILARIATRKQEGFRGVRQDTLRDEWRRRESERRKSVGPSGHGINLDSSEGAMDGALLLRYGSLPKGWTLRGLVFNWVELIFRFRPVLTNCVQWRRDDHNIYTLSRGQREIHFGGLRCHPSHHSSIYCVSCVSSRDCPLASLSHLVIWLLTRRLAFQGL